MDQKLIKHYIEELKYDELYDYVIKEVEKNNSDALCMMGDMYYFGIGVDEDLENAIYYYQLAYELNHILAKDRLGQIYYEKAEYILNYANSLFSIDQYDLFKASAALKYAYATFEKSASYGYMLAYRRLNWDFYRYQDHMS